MNNMDASLNIGNIVRLLSTEAERYPDIDIRQPAVHGGQSDTWLA